MLKTISRILAQLAQPSNFAILDLNYLRMKQKHRQNKNYEFCATNRWIQLTIIVSTNQYLRLSESQRWTKHLWIVGGGEASETTGFLFDVLSRFVHAFLRAISESVFAKQKHCKCITFRLSNPKLIMHDLQPPKTHEWL